MTTNNQNTSSTEWFFEDENEKELGIETQNYDNGNKVKRAKLSDGRVAVARELLGKDMKHVDRICNGNKDEYLPALMSVAVKIYDADGKELKFVMEDMDNMKGKDYTKIKMIATSLNF